MVHKGRKREEDCERERGRKGGRERGERWRGSGGRKGERQGGRDGWKEGGKERVGEKFCITNNFLLFIYFTRLARTISLPFLLFLIARTDNINHFNPPAPLSLSLSVQTTINRIQISR